MLKTQLNLETITPMFLRGYDNEQLELRPPPFKALFRYWWRAAQGFNIANALRDAEAKLFGSTDRKAPFSIYIPGTVELKEHPYRLLPHKTNMDPVPAYDAAQQFDLHLITQDPSVASTYKQIAKLGFLLGGVGNRSRRGFGSIRDVNWNFTDVNNLRQEVLNTLNHVASATHFQINGNIIASTLTSFPRYPVIQRVYFGNCINDIDHLLKEVGRATHNHSHSALGGINPRMASPIHVRIQKVNGKFVPIVTQVNSVFPGAAPSNCLQKQQNFINAVISII